MTTGEHNKAFVDEDDHASETRRRSGSNDSQTRYRSVDIGSIIIPRQDTRYAVDSAIEAIGVGKFQILLVFIVGYTWFAGGAVSMTMSILPKALRCEWNIEPWQEAFINTITFIGQFLGAYYWGYLSDRYGRTFVMWLSGAYCFFFSILLTFTPNLTWFFAIRLGLGIGLAGGLQIVTVFSELLPIALRGKVILLVSLFWTVGSIFELLLAALIMPSPGLDAISNWRLLLMVTASVYIIYFILVWFLPESPRFLMSKMRYEEVEKVLKKIADFDHKTLPGSGLLIPDKVKVESSVAEKSCLEKVKALPIGDMFYKKYARTTMCLAVIWFASAFSYYGEVLMAAELAGSDNICQLRPDDGNSTADSCGVSHCNVPLPSEYIDQIYNTMAEVPAILLTVFIVDRIGRRKLLALLFLVFSASMFALYICTPTKWVAQIALFVARAVITVEFQIAYVYTPEVYPTNVRAMALGVVTAFSRLGSLVAPFIAQVLVNSRPFIGVALFGGLSLLCSGLSLLLPFETLNKDLPNSVYDVDMS